MEVTGGKIDVSQDSDFQNRQVEAKMLKTDFIFSQYGGYERVGYRELVIAMAGAPQESLFSTELVTTLISTFWDRYYKTIFIWCFLPFCVYLISTVTYITIHAQEPFDQAQKWAFT